MLEGLTCTVKDTSSHNENPLVDRKPNLTMFNAELGKEVWGADHPANHKKAEDWYGAGICFAWSICLMEVKASTSQDLFVEKDGEIVFSGSKAGRRTREQIFRYVIELFVRQHRESAFIILIIGRQARLTRWDRKGVITTELFDYMEGDHHLFNFIYRLATADRTSQGFDTTVRLASQNQIEDLKAFKETRTNEYERQFVEGMLENEELHPIQQVCTSDTVLRTQ